MRNDLNYTVGDYTLKFNEKDEPCALVDEFEKQELVFRLDTHSEASRFLYFSGDGMSFTAVRVDEDFKPDGFVVTDNAASDILMEDLEAVWQGEATPAYMDKDVIDLDLIADAFGWEKKTPTEYGETHRMGLKEVAARTQEICREMKTGDEVDCPDRTTALDGQDFSHDC